MSRFLSDRTLSSRLLSATADRAVISAWTGSPNRPSVPGRDCFEFLSTATVTVLVAGWVDAVLQAGGGGYQGNGGGAGGHIATRIWLPEGTHDLVVGAGGAPGNNGGDTYINVRGRGLIFLAKGGGLGPAAWGNGGPGGSGGGGVIGGAATYAGQGYAGGSAAPGLYLGGGGAGGAAPSAGPGGPGIANDLTGTVLWYAAGGGGNSAADGTGWSTRPGSGCGGNAASTTGISGSILLLA